MEVGLNLTKLVLPYVTFISGLAVNFLRIKETTVIIKWHLLCTVTPTLELGIRFSSILSQYLYAFLVCVQHYAVMCGDNKTIDDVPPCYYKQNTSAMLLGKLCQEIIRSVYL